MTAPGYWMDETGSELAPAIKRYLDGADLTTRDLWLIRAYIRQWIDSPVWDANPAQTASSRLELAALRTLARSLNSRESIADWLALAENFGVDPL
jgi:hypothetical protein